MANDFDDFNYDPDDIELNDEGLPEEENDSSLEDLMDIIKQLQDEDDDEEEDEEDGSDDNDSSNQQRKKDDDSSSNKPDQTEKADGGRYGDKTSPTDKRNLGQKPQSSSPTTPKPSGGGDDWFSKFANKFSKGGGGAGAKAGGALAQGAGAGAAGAGAGAGAAGGAVAGGIAAGGWVILIILLIVILLVAVVAVVAYLNKRADPENMGTNTIITSEYFYGTRSIYIDENILTAQLQLSYKQYIIDVVENFEENNLSIDITIELPQLTEVEIFTNETIVDEHITNLSLGIANIVATGSSEYSNIDFNALYPQIQYFGLSAEQLTLAQTLISDYIVNNSLYSTQDAGASVGDLIKTTITDDEDLQYILNRAEKVMIKDTIATEEGLQGIKIQQYIANIYMPNKDIVIESSSYIISSTAEEFNATSKLIEENNGTETIHREKETEDNRDIITGFISGKLNIKKFTNIDENNLEAFSAGMSLFSALRLSAEYKNFFTVNADGIYTWKPNCDSLYYLTFEAETPFIFTDFDMNVKLP